MEIKNLIDENGNLNILELKCPDCGFDYVHYGKPALGKIHDKLSIKIPMMSECGSMWNVVIRNYEGSTIIGIEMVERCSGPFVYFIYCKELNRVKIGVSENPRERMQKLQTASPGALKMLAKENGGITKEKELHNKFGNLRVHGEWFEFDKQIQDYIKDIPTNELDWSFVEV